MMSSAQRVMKRKQSKGPWPACFSSLLIKISACSFITSRNSARIEKWKVGVSIFRRRRHFSPVLHEGDMISLSRVGPADYFSKHRTDVQVRIREQEQTVSPEGLGLKARLWALTVISLHQPKGWTSCFPMACFLSWDSHCQLLAHHLLFTFGHSILRCNFNY